ncbi:papain-like cysteine protease family protein [Desertivirga brevis]|uniref:papain-like cysteine protease family protein n=1 Tax=Desertivirga brevis TaxID=2810310 RepID=UPI001A961098|nr:papain-like cysteine protease family protein [Pedobacter sp. SYSU D00873]
MSISIYIEPITNGEELVKKLLQDEFGISDVTSGILFTRLVKPYFDNFKDSTFILAESNYVDKVYRDSYYHYYSSKLPKYKRDCVRLSFFEDQISDTDFFNGAQHPILQKKYRGFIVLRPTDPFIIGRSIVSPYLLKNNSNFISCISKFHTTVNGVKFTVKGFPHSSQDTETISCAETSLWAIMEYFSNKYSNYQPVLPSKIIKTLNQVSSERQVPSKGLNIAQMSYALKEFGFGTRIYSKQQYAAEFEGLLSCYIESGIPVIMAIDNRHRGGSIGHALLAIGHNKIEDNQINSLVSYKTSNTTLAAGLAAKSIVLYDYDSITKDFVFIDDNHPPYQKAPLS